MTASTSETANPDVVFQVDNLHHWYGPKLVLHDVNLRIARGQIVSLVGPSGCGKSTLLRSLLGTQQPSKGTVRVYDAQTRQPHVVDAPGRDRGIVYQRYALFPFLTAIQNVAIGPKLDQTSFPGRLLTPWNWFRLRRQHLEEAEQILVRLGLGDALHRYPHELSGGMRQRVAIGQAMVMKPEILLLDEPFGALDEATREDLQLLLLELYEENIAAKTEGKPPPYTILIVTHELNEAIYVGDRVLGLSQYWNWQGAGLPASPGATIVYDKVAPVYSPKQEKRWEEFVAQREEIRAHVFEPKTAVDPDVMVEFWDVVARGESAGVTAV